LTIASPSAAMQHSVGAAQERRIPVVGGLSNATPERTATLWAVIHKALAEAGFVEGRTLKVEYRFAGSDPDRFPALAADLVARATRRRQPRARLVRGARPLRRALMHGNGHKPPPWPALSSASNTMMAARVGLAALVHRPKPSLLERSDMPGNLGIGTDRGIKGRPQGTNGQHDPSGCSAMTSA
jgi:hypothetical protein